GLVHPLDAAQFSRVVPTSLPVGGHFQRHTVASVPFSPVQSCPQTAMRPPPPLVLPEPEPEPPPSRPPPSRPPPPSRLPSRPPPRLSSGPPAVGAAAVMAIGAWETDVVAAPAGAATPRANGTANATATSGLENRFMSGPFGATSGYLQ